jgi:hypothetical protein
MNPVDRTLGYALHLARDPDRRTREKALMSAPGAPLIGDELLDAVTAEMVVFHERYHHRTPVTAKTLLLGDEVLVCVLAGVYSDVEKTLIEVQRGTLVQQVRGAFQVAMEDRFIATEAVALGPGGRRRSRRRRGRRGPSRCRFR